MCVCVCDVEKRGKHIISAVYYVRAAINFISAVYYVRAVTYIERIKIRIFTVGQTVSDEKSACYVPVSHVTLSDGDVIVCQSYYSVC